jgi:hypothetical protein
VVEKLGAGDYLARISDAAAAGGVEGRIIKVEGNRAWINLGMLSHVHGAHSTFAEELDDPV